jgi:hypothetical protein
MVEEKVTNLENSKPFVLQPQLDGKLMTEEAVKKLLNVGVIGTRINIDLISMLLYFIID